MHNKELKAKFQKFWVNTNLYYCWKVLLRNYKSKNIEVVCTAMYPLVNDPYSHDTSLYYMQHEGENFMDEIVENI